MHLGHRFQKGDVNVNEIDKTTQQTDKILTRIRKIN